MLLGHLNNQNAVLGGQADQRHQTHLGIDVEIDRAQAEEHQSPEHRQGHRHQDDHGSHITLVLSREHEVDDQHPQAEHQHAGIAS